MKIKLPEELYILYGDIILKKLENAIISNNYWKAIFVIHSIIQEMLWEIAIYGHAKRKGRRLLNRYYGVRYDMVRQRPFDQFYNLVNLCFISNFIGRGLRTNLLKFNSKRNDMAHLELYDKDDNLSNFDDDSEVESLLQSGIKLMKYTSKAQERIMSKIF